MDKDAVWQSELSVKTRAYECITNNQETIKARKCAILAFNDTVALGVFKCMQGSGAKSAGRRADIRR